MRFKDLCEEYFKLYTPNNLKPITEYNYKQMYKARLLPFFGNMKLKDINTALSSNYFCNLTTVAPNRNRVPLVAGTTNVYDSLSCLSPGLLIVQP